jgi:hypothetical protein
MYYSYLPAAPQQQDAPGRSATTEIAHVAPQQATSSASAKQQLLCVEASPSIGTSPPVEQLLYLSDLQTQLFTGMKGGDPALCVVLLLAVYMHVREGIAILHMCIYANMYTRACTNHILAFVHVKPMEIKHLLWCRASV